MPQSQGHQEKTRMKLENAPKVCILVNIHIMWQKCFQLNLFVYFISLLFFRKDLVPFENCNVTYWYEVFGVEKAGSQVNENDPEAESYSPVKREFKFHYFNMTDSESAKPW